jgi:solute:Na+ symporter, SSS family
MLSEAVFNSDPVYLFQQSYQPMQTNWITLSIFAAYLTITTLLGFWQSRRIKKAEDFVLSSLSPWKAAAFLAGFTLGGAATYGVAGDTIKFGYTYMFWFPVSVAAGWWITGALFARPYYRMRGVTVPALLAKRFNENTRLACSISTMLYAFFIVLLELYTLAIIIRALAPNLSMIEATIISLLVNIFSVAFSGILGASTTNLVHSWTLIVAFALSLMALWNVVGGWNTAIERVTEILPAVASPGITSEVWFSMIGLGWGAAGQLMIGKSGRLGGISVVSNIAASCRSERQARQAFWIAGILSGLPPLFAGALGIFTAAFLGADLADMPAYSSIGMAMVQVSPVLAGLLLAAVAGAIISTFGPVLIVFSSVFVEDIVKKIVPLTDIQQRVLYPLSIILLTSACGYYVATHGIQDIIPFVYTTAFPCTVPITVVALFGVYGKRSSAQAAFWAIVLGVILALIWGLGLNNPLGIPNMYIALLVPLLIMTVDVMKQSFGQKFSSTQLIE